jgi:hypothetical protein
LLHAYKANNPNTYFEVALGRTGLLESDGAVAQSLRIAGSLLLLGAVLRAMQAALAPAPASAAAPDPLRAEEEALARSLADGSRRA